MFPSLNQFGQKLLLFLARENIKDYQHETKRQLYHTTELGEKLERQYRPCFFSFFIYLILDVMPYVLLTF